LFWEGSFGDAYMKRNKGKQLLASNLAFFSKALRCTQNLKTCLEFGANLGFNLMALKTLFPNLDVHAVEINKKAAAHLKKIIPPTKVFPVSILDFASKKKWDLVVTKGLLIHIDPQALKDAYKKLVKASNRYLLVAEYYDPKPTKLPYREYADRLFKRDFAGELIDKHKLRLLDYGFIYHRDTHFPQDDINWSLLEKT
jgi:spore coat polysaccharide biosynthesis protein SpsF